MSIQSKINRYLNSPAGQQRLQAERERILASGATHLANGKEIVTAETAAKLASELAAMISAAAAAVPGVDSSVGCSAPVRNGKCYAVDLSFTGDLGRASLYQGGISNIIALFNNGYSASAPVYGMWHGKHIKSLTSRPELGFMQNAVDEFNARYAGKYNVRVVLSGDYS